MSRVFALKGKYSDLSPGNHLTVGLVNRAITIAFAIGWEGDEQRALRQSVVDLYGAAKNTEGPGFFRTADLALRSGIIRERDRRRDLHLKLSDAQIDVQDDFGVFKQELELTDILQQTKNALEGLSLEQALREFALIAIPRKPETLVEEARKMANEFPLSGLFPTVVVDERGRTIAKEGMTEIGEASRHLILRNQSIEQTIAVGGQIEPAREIIYSEKGLTEAYLIALCRLSPFVPNHAAVMLGEGFFAFFQREYAKAGSFCLPYLEACLRHVLDQAGEPTTVIKSEGVESNINLSQILNKHREQIERIIPVEYIFAIENLFDHPLGDTYRHRFAHGLLSRVHYFSHSMIYGLWLIFSLTVLPLLNQWDEVTKIIKAELR